MVSTRYRPKDLKLARRHILKAAHRFADQEMLIRKLLRKGRPSGSAYALLKHCFDQFQPIEFPPLVVVEPAEQR
ncbi:hypothetical protein AB9E28_35745, partial [Rhizobium leguminosarum]